LGRLPEKPQWLNSAGRLTELMRIFNNCGVAPRESPIASINLTGGRGEGFHRDETSVTSLMAAPLLLHLLRSCCSYTFQAAERQQTKVIGKQTDRQMDITIA